MPDELKNKQGDVDWAKLILTMATAILFVLQGVGFTYHTNLKEKVDVIHSNYVEAAHIVPRGEYNKDQDNLIPKDEVLILLKALNDRLDRMEEGKETN